MKITKHQLRSIVREEIAHPRDNLGTGVGGDKFPIVVGYEGKSEIAYHQEELDNILDDIAPRGIKYSLNSLDDMEPRSKPSGAEIEQLGENMKITKRQLRRLIKETLLIEGGNTASYYGSGGDDEFEARISVKYSDSGSADIDWSVKTEKWNNDEGKMETITVHDGEDDNIDLPNFEALYDKQERGPLQDAMYKAKGKWDEGERYY